MYTVRWGEYRFPRQSANEHAFDFFRRGREAAPFPRRIRRRIGKLARLCRDAAAGRRTLGWGALRLLYLRRARRRRIAPPDRLGAYRPELAASARARPLRAAVE